MLTPEPLGEHLDDRGRFIEIWSGDDWSECNYLEIRNGTRRGGHYHKTNRELMIVARGKCRVHIADMRSGDVTETTFGEGEFFIIEPFEKHTLTALEDCALVTLNTHPYDRDDPDVFSD